jgi:glycosyltransferase involved in cell wall biosynthesis
MKKIIFYGPLGIAKPVLGGGEAGNKRTFALLKNAGYDIEILEKPYLIEIPVLREFIAPLQFFYKMILLIVKRFGMYRNAGIFHLSAFYYKLMFFEYVFISIAGKMGLKTIYEIRAGGMIHAYKHGSSWYKKLFLWTIKKSDLILCQGKEYCTFLEKEFNIQSVYYPNYIQNSLITENNLVKKRILSDKLQLVYFGRLVDSKRIDFIIKTASELKKKEMSFNLNIIGSGNESYIEGLKNLVSELRLEEQVIFHGRMMLDKMSEILKRQHFFLFPSNEMREGHSNSLTEAMSFGIVPIVSNVGFNASVVDENELVVNDDNPICYAEKIVEIYNDLGHWERLSNMMHQRINKNFTESVVSKLLLDAYKNLS